MTLSKSTPKIAEGIGPLPSSVTDDYWVRAHRTKGKYPSATARSGKWLIFVPREKADEWWIRLVPAVRAGRLGSSAKIATAVRNAKAISDDEIVICVYTYDSDDVEDVMRVRAELRELGVTWPIPYKPDAATRAGQYGAKGHKGIAKYFE